MSWTDVFPVLTDDQVAEYQLNATFEDAELLDGCCDVARVVNPQAGKHLVVASLFGKNARKEEGELPPVTRQLMMDAAKLGLVSRFAQWNHYVLPLLDAARTLNEARPDLAFRVYPVADLEDLVED
ncbi:MAG: hypothetical protein WCK77_08585 [Verrucomicrobiota bacterium]